MGRQPGERCALHPAAQLRLPDMQWHPNGDLLCAGFRSRLYQVIDPRSQSNVCEWIVGPQRSSDA